MQTGFHVVETGRQIQSATMTLDPGEASGPKSNEHSESEQCLIVLEGEVHAEVGERTFTLRKGESTIVPRGVAHRFTNRGHDRALTVNVYGPPAY
jgi:mannose-6-phosphate isomerase-like protein (cupin superfamily)